MYGHDLTKRKNRSKYIALSLFLSLTSNIAFTQGRNTIQFAAIGDTQIAHTDQGCRTSGIPSETKYTVKALNSFYGTSGVKWPSNIDFKSYMNPIQKTAHKFNNAGQFFGKPKFLFIAGDVTENGNGDGCDEFAEYEKFFPTNGGTGTDEVRYGVFEGLGNHDFPYTTESQVGTASKDIARKIYARLDAKISAPTIDKQSDDRGSYSWEEQAGDIRFINLNVKPSGGASKVCSGLTNKAHGYLTELSDTKCREYIRKNGLIRLIDPNLSLGYLNNLNISNRQVVIFSHYGPKSQTRIANDELKNFCEILEQKKLRVIAWIVGHTHKSDYYEWKCGDYRTPVFNVGSGNFDQTTTTGSLNKGEVHFGYFRIGKKWLEAIDIGYNPTANIYAVPGTGATSDTNCKYSRGEKLGKDTPYLLKKNSEFDHRDSTNSKWCNPDGKWGNWAARIRICPKGQNPFQANGDVNPNCVI